MKAYSLVSIRFVMCVFETHIERHSFRIALCVSSLQVFFLIDFHLKSTLSHSNHILRKLTQFFTQLIPIRRFRTSLSITICLRFSFRLITYFSKSCLRMRCVFFNVRRRRRKIVLVFEQSRVFCMHQLTFSFGSRIRLCIKVNTNFTC